MKVWGFPSGRLIATPERNDAAGSVAFSPNGRLLAYATRSHGLKIWDIEANQETINFPGRYGFEYEEAALVFSPDGNTLAATGGGEPQILLWNIQKKTLSMTLKGHSEASLLHLFSRPMGKPWLVEATITQSGFGHWQLGKKSRGLPITHTEFQVWLSRLTEEFWHQQVGTRRYGFGILMRDARLRC